MSFILKYDIIYLLVKKSCIFALSCFVREELSRFSGSASRFHSEIIRFNLRKRYTIQKKSGASALFFFYARNTESLHSQEIPHPYFIIMAALYTPLKNQNSKNLKSRVCGRSVQRYKEEKKRPQTSQIRRLPCVPVGTKRYKGSKKRYTIGHKPRKYAVYEDFQSKSNFAKYTLRSTRKYIEIS